MTIQEAIKSGQPFKRPGMDRWIVLDTEYGWLDYEAYKGHKYGARVGAFRSDTILADDWEVKETGGGKE